MIISRTPFRISFLGGGTDYPAWYLKNGGAVLATTINKYCYITCRYLPPFFEHRIRVVYSKIENCQRIEEISHPAVREVLRFMKVDRGVEIHHDGDLPARSGLGSSSAFTVGLLNALYALEGQMPSKHQLALESIHVEQQRLAENVGSQDQVLAAYGGLSHITFSPTGDISVSPLTLKPERISEFNSSLMLFFTGINRTASDIVETFIQDVDRRKVDLASLAAMVNEGLSILGGKGELNDFGRLLHEAWLVKRSLSAKVSNSDIEEIYSEALAAGALGGKLIGAGGGGFMLLYVPPADQAAVRQRLKRLLHVPFKFEALGSRIIFYDPEADYTAEDKARVTEPPRVFRELGDPKPE